MTSDFAKRFNEIFSGLERAYGTFNITGKKGNKAIGKAITKKKPVTDELWNDHLLGKTPIGIVPIRDDNSCVFGVIDIDSYDNFDVSGLSVKCAQEDLPVVVFRSKSGGAHVYLFTYEPVPASLMRSKLEEISTAIGQPDCEIFPKQNRLRNKDDIGNWINMPYFNCAKTDRFAFFEGYPLSAEEFLAKIDEFSLSKKELKKIEIKSGEFSDGPPCIEKLTLSGFPKGSMNNALFDMGVYARMKFPEDWQRVIFDYNERFMGPGTPQEVHQIIKSLDRKKYIFRCNEDPICGVCNKVICAQRQYGISSDKIPYKTSAGQKSTRPCILDEVETPITCYVPPEGSDDEPYWTFKIHKQEMDVTVDMIRSQSKFLREYLKKFHKVVLSIDETRWMVAMNDLLDGADIQELAPDAGPEGQLMIHLENFCNGKVQAKVKDEIALGKPWFDKEGEQGFGPRVFFRSPDFQKYLDLQRFKVFNMRQIYAILRRSGAVHNKFMIKGACVASWGVHPFSAQTEAFDDIDVSTIERTQEDIF